MSDVTPEEAIVETLRTVDVTGAKLSMLHRSVESVVGKITRGKVQSIAGELGKDGAIWFDAVTDKYFLEGVVPEADEGPDTKLSILIVDFLLESHKVGRSTDGQPFVVGNKSHVVTAISTRKFREHISALSWDQFREPASKSVVEEVAAVITGMSTAVEPTAVWSRVAPLGRTAVVIDLGDIDENVIVATTTGWAIHAGSPGPMFIRTELTAPMPTPTEGREGSLWNVIRVAENRRDLVLGLLASALIPEAPHLILSLVGEQGTAKTETLRAISLLIDPLTAPTRTLPSDVRDLAVTLAGSWAIAFDNVSYIRADISDALCRSVTGDSWVARSLYTDAEISSITFQRIIMLDGIDLGVLRGDFLDRAVLIELEAIPDDERRTLFTWNMGQLGVRDFFTEYAPVLLATILDALVDILAGLELVDMAELPRMADAAVLLAAMDKSRGTESIEQYRAARQENVVLGVESDQVAMKVREYTIKMHRNNNGSGHTHAWVGSATKLLENLTPLDIPKGWPTTAHHFSGRLKRSAPGLRAVGIEVKFGRDRNSRSVMLTYRPDDTQDTEPSLIDDAAEVF